MPQIPHISAGFGMARERGAETARGKRPVEPESNQPAGGPTSPFPSWAGGVPVPASFAMRTERQASPLNNRAGSAVRRPRVGAVALGPRKNRERSGLRVDTRLGRQGDGQQTRQYPELPVERNLHVHSLKAGSASLHGQAVPSRGRILP